MLGFFHEGNKCYPQFFLDECSYNLQMLQYDKIDASEGIDIYRNNALHKCVICHYWYFLEKNLSFQSKMCNGRHEFLWCCNCLC